MFGKPHTINSKNTEAFKENISANQIITSLKFSIGK